MTITEFIARWSTSQAWRDESACMIHPALDPASADEHRAGLEVKTMIELSANRIDVKGYRCFESLVVDGFKRVNLIVGRNNAGKTALLEALEIGLTNGHPARVFRPAERRGEHFRPVNEATSKAFGKSSFLDVRQIFRGRSLEVNPKVTLTLWGRRKDQAVAQTTELIVGGSRTETRKLKCRPTGGPGWEEELVEGAGIHPEAPSHSLIATNPTNVQSLTPERITPALAARLWSQVLQPSRGEAAVAEALRFLDPNVEDVICVDTEGLLGWSSFLIGLRGQSVRVPLASLGEGAGRLFQIAMTAAAARRGALLIDEIDTGLHYSVFQRMWPWLLALARDEQNGFQIFASTHSDDCIRSLAALASDPTNAADIAFFRLEPGATTAVAGSGADLAQAVASGVEVR